MTPSCAADFGEFKDLVDSMLDISEMIEKLGKKLKESILYISYQLCMHKRIGLYIQDCFLVSKF